MINLMGAWHSQLIEVLGAMGIREVRRLRGEVGRAIFLEDMEKEAFGDLPAWPWSSDMNSPSGTTMGNTACFEGAVFAATSCPEPPAGTSDISDRLFSDTTKVLA